MDKELAELVSKFQSIQHQASAERCVNERNAVEIVMLLKQRKLIDLLYTSDGKEYLTWSHLEKEVYDEIEVHGGRINIVDLPSLLNVDLGHIEHIIDTVVAKDSRMTILDGEIMTTQYLGSLVSIAAEDLRESGCVMVSDFAKTSHLTTVFLHKLFSDEIQNGNLVALIDDTALYTTDFVHRQALSVKCALLAATRPVSLHEFCGRHHIFPQIFPRILESLITSGDLRGRIEGSAVGGQYVPSLFEKSRDTAVHNVYTSNGAISFSALGAYGIANPSSYLTSRYNPASAASAPTATKGKSSRGKGKKKAESTAAPAVCATDEHPWAGHVLSNCFISDRALSNAVADIQSVTNNDVPCVQLSEKLPSAIDFNNSEDCDLITNRLLSLFPDFGDACVIVQSSWAVNKAAINGLDSQFKALAQTDLAQTRKAQHGESGTLIKSMRSIELLITKALQLEADRDGDVITEVIDLWRDHIEGIYREVQEQLASQGTVSIKKLRAEMQKKAQDTWYEISIGLKGTQWAAANSSMQSSTAAVNKALIQRHGEELVRLLLTDLIGTEDPELFEKLVTSDKVVAPKSIPGMCNERVRKAVTPIVKTLDSANAVEMCDKLEELSSSGEVSVPLHPPNKKLERELQANLRAKLVDTVRGSSFGSDVAANGTLFASVCELLLLKHFRVHASLTGKAVSSAISAICADEENPELTSCGVSVIDMLKSGSADSDVVGRLESLRQTALNAFE